MGEQHPQFAELGLDCITPDKPSGVLELRNKGIKSAVLVVKRAEIAQARIGLGSDMLGKGSREPGLTDTTLAGKEHHLAIASLGLATGTISGFFGIGGGFLIVPALMLATGMPIMNAVSSSLVAVTAFGLTTAASYAWSGLVSWALAGLFVAGGFAGGLAGTRSARHLAERRGALNIVFAVVIIAVALYMLARNISLSPA